MRGQFRGRVLVLLAAVLFWAAAPASTQEVEALFFRAWVALRAGQTATAEAILEALRKTHPEDPRPYLGLGDLAFFRREYARSLQFYGKALALSPSDLRVLAGLGKWAFFAGDPEGARRRLREVLSRKPDDFEARAYLTYLGEPADWPEPLAKAVASGRIARGEMAGVLAAHLADVSGLKESPFTEVLTDVSSHWARDAIWGAVRKGWMRSRPDHTFGPAEPLTRAGLAEVVYNVFLSAGVRAADGLEERRPGDVLPEHRSLQMVLFVLGRGLMDRTEGGNFSPAGPVSGREAIETLERVKRLLFPTGLKRGEG
ncbi:MAG: tetratricopeptide repeat protein [Candidatus Tectomicrobia bacterium]|nr:tetratricopeptide repeat protein [Candidatus Tectomicrobia bacterium]